MYGIDPQHVRVYNLVTRCYQMVRAANFNPYDRNTDPVVTTTAAFATKPRRQPIPKNITSSTPPPAPCTKHVNTPMQLSGQKHITRSWTN